MTSGEGPRSPGDQDAVPLSDGPPEQGHAGEGGLPRIGFIGAGRVGLALGRAFSGAGWPVTAVASRDPGRRARFQGAVSGARAYAEPAAVLDDADVVFLTVRDDAIAEVWIFEGDQYLVDQLVAES